MVAQGPWTAVVIWRVVEVQISNDQTFDVSNDWRVGVAQRSHDHEHSFKLLSVH